MNIDDFKRREGENERQYLWRIGRQIEDGTAGFTWDEAAPYINAEWRTDESEYRTSSAYRKPVQYAIGFWNDVFSKECPNANAVETQRLEGIRQEIQRERYKLQATKAEYNRALRANSRFELFYENVRDAIVELEPPVMNPLCDQNEDRQWVLGIGDIHYGSMFLSEHNQYSREIVLDRFQKLLGGLKDEIARNDISHLHIINVSDTIQGILRLSDININNIPVVQSVVEASQIIATFLNTLSEDVEISYYHVPCSNHAQTRPLGSKANELATEDLEYIIVHYINDLLAKNERVQVYSNLGKDYISFRIFDFNILALHGHQIKNLDNVLTDYTTFHRCVYDYAFIGHYHAPVSKCVGMGETWNTEVLVCPAFVGSDPYSDTLLKGTQPMARLYEFDRLNGHRSDINIFLGNKQENVDDDL